MRGKAEEGTGKLYGKGITPADAGKSPQERGKVSATWDNPHRCGEKASKVLNRKHLHEVVLKFH